MHSKVRSLNATYRTFSDKLGVVTTALFNQRDFTDLSILDAFGESLEASIRSQMTESGLLMGTSL